MLFIESFDVAKVSQRTGEPDLYFYECTPRGLFSGHLLRILTARSHRILGFPLSTFLIISSHLLFLSLPSTYILVLIAVLESYVRFLLFVVAII